MIQAPFTYNLSGMTRRKTPVKVPKSLILLDYFQIENSHRRVNALLELKKHHAVESVSP